MSGFPDITPVPRYVVGFPVEVPALFLDTIGNLVERVDASAHTSLSFAAARAAMLVGMGSPDIPSGGVFRLADPDAGVSGTLLEVLRVERTVGV